MIRIKIIFKRIKLIKKLKIKYNKIFKNILNMKYVIKIYIGDIKLSI